MLTSDQRATLRAMVDRIIPADEFPSGWDAGVGDYLDRAFAGDLHEHVARYAAGLDALDGEAQTRQGTSFTALAPDAQDALLSLVENGNVATAWSSDPVAFFRELLNLIMEGFYSDPANGGNHNTVSWKMIGFEVRG